MHSRSVLGQCLHVTCVTRLRLCNEVVINIRTLENAHYLHVRSEYFQLWSMKHLCENLFEEAQSVDVQPVREK